MGWLLYYGRAVNPTILPGVNELGMVHAVSTQKNSRKSNRLVDYLLHTQQKNSDTK